MALQVVKRVSEYEPVEHDPLRNRYDALLGLIEGRELHQNSIIIVRHIAGCGAEVEVERRSVGLRCMDLQGGYLSRISWYHWQPRVLTRSRLNSSSYLYGPLRTLRVGR